MYNENLLEIPDPISIAGWKEVPIEECGEPLIVLNELDPKIVVLPQYNMQGIPLASPIQRLRQGAVERLIESVHLLPDKYQLVIFDAHRPLAVQKSLFDTQVASLKEQRPDWSEKDLEEEAQRYVSIPSSNPQKPSPHSTGGAVDLSILDPDGRQLNMGTKFDHFGIEAQTAYFRNSRVDEGIHNNRRLLYSAMIASGFTNYPEEWWHFDFGNQFWGKIAGEVAIYGLGQIKEIAPSAEEEYIKKVDSIFYSIGSDDLPERFSRRFGLAGSPNNLKALLEELSTLNHPHFGIKQQLVEIAAARHNVRRFAF